MDSYTEKTLTITGPEAQIAAEITAAQERGWTLDRRYLQTGGWYQVAMSAPVTLAPPAPPAIPQAALLAIDVASGKYRIGARVGSPAAIGPLVIQRFAGGADTDGECAIIWNERGGTWLLRNGFYRWCAGGWSDAAGLLGWPVEDEHGTELGAEQRWARGMMTWDRASNKITVV